MSKKLKPGIIVPFNEDDDNIKASVKSLTLDCDARGSTIIIRGSFEVEIENGELHDEEFYKDGEGGGMVYIPFEEKKRRIDKVSLKNKLIGAEGVNGKEPLALNFKLNIDGGKRRWGI